MEPVQQPTGEPIIETVYFVRNGTDGPIKIGKTRGAVGARMAALQTGNPVPLMLLAAIEGADEAEIHGKFAGCRMTGEWFAPVPILLAFIDGVNAANHRRSHYMAFAERHPIVDREYGVPVLFPAKYAHRSFVDAIAAMIRLKLPGVDQAMAAPLGRWCTGHGVDLVDIAAVVIRVSDDYGHMATGPIFYDAIEHEEEPQPDVLGRARDLVASVHPYAHPLRQRIAQLEADKVG